LKYLVLISTILLSAEEFCKAVSMNEDKSRIRNNPDIYARLKSSAINIW